MSRVVESTEEWKQGKASPSLRFRQGKTDHDQSVGLRYEFDYSTVLQYLLTIFTMTATSYHL